MFSETNTEDIVKSRMLDNVGSDLDKREGSFVYDAISPASIEVALAYIALDQVLQLGFAETSSGDYLKMRAHEHGVEERAATCATGPGAGLITGTPGAVVAVGSIFTTGSGEQFATTTAVTLADNGLGTVDIAAVNAGIQGNVPIGAITLIPVTIPGVISFTNALETSGGSDAESDADLLARLREKVRQPATSGNVAHYVQWAKETPEVGDARVLPLWNGPGTVKVVIIDTNMSPANSTIVGSVSTHIEDSRPIGALVTVESAEGLNINVNATVQLEAGALLSDAQATFETMLTTYIGENAFLEDFIRYAKIGSLLLSVPKVLDYSDLLVNGSAENVVVGETQVPVKGMVVLSE